MFLNNKNSNVIDVIMNGFKEVQIYQKSVHNVKVHIGTKNE